MYSKYYNGVKSVDRFVCGDCTGPRVGCGGPVLEERGQEAEEGDSQQDEAAVCQWMAVV